MRPRILIPLLGFVLLLGGPAGGSDPGLQKLSSEDEEFLSQVGYILTPAERKEFLALPEGERADFIDNFWKRRDPDPATPENEFKDEYLGRISQAGRLFFGEGRPGWLTDRGRIYVLFGPPDQRTATSSAASPDGRCQELWYYRDFPVVFLDRACTGTFRLATLDLSPIADLSLARESAPKPLLPAEKKATSIPSGSNAARSSTSTSRPITSRVRPLERSEAARRTDAQGNDRSSRRRASSLPTAPVAPMTAVR